MNLLARFFSLGRLSHKPKAQTAGKLLPPASVQRSQLGLAEVDLPRGVIAVRGGEVRCVLRVSGFPLHTAGGADSRAFLSGLAAALNAMPPEASFLIRSSAGVVANYIREMRDQTDVIAWHGPGTALARLAADQLAHLRGLHDSGAVRRTECFVAIRNRQGNRHAMAQTAATVMAHLQSASLRCDLVKDRQLAEAISWSWGIGIAEGAVWRWPDWSLEYERGRGGARVVPTPPEPQARPQPRASVLTLPYQTHTNGRALPG